MTMSQEAGLQLSKHASATDLAQVNVLEIQLTQARHKLPGLWQSQTALPLRGQYHHDNVLICSLQGSRITVVETCLSSQLTWHKSTFERFI